MKLFPVSGLRSRLLPQALLLLGLGAPLASAKVVTYQYLRFHPIQLRSSTANVQVAEFQFFNGTTPVTGATVTDDGNNSPDTEGPEKAFDGLNSTKWLNRAFGGAFLVFDFGSPRQFDRYNFVTGNDFIDRDPITWVIEGSANGEDWEPVDVIANYPVPTGRNVPATTEPFIFPEQVLPLVNTFEFYNFDQPSIVENGSEVKFYYSTTYATSVTLADDAGTAPLTASDPEVGDFTVVPPADRTTVYTLNATNADKTGSRSISVRSVARQTQNFRYARFTPVKLRAGGTTVQLSEFEFFNAGDPVTVAAATNPGGTSAGTTETPPNLIDGDTATKWLSTNLSPLVFDFGVPKDFDGYSFSTGNDFADRDPLQWVLEGSNDNTSWTLIENVTSFSYPTTTTRYTASGDLPIPGPSVPPAATLSVDAATLISGEPVKLTYWTLGASTITFDPPIGTTNASGTVTLNPTETTTYTLTATNATGQSSTRSVTVNVIVPTGIIDYPNFETAPEISLVGAAQIVNDFTTFPNSPNAKRLRLTNLTTNQTGSAWSLSKQKVTDGFVSTFDAHIAFPVYVNGADGVAFTIQNVAAKYTAAPTSELEFADKAVTIKLDSYNDRTGETQANLEVYVGTTRKAIYNLDRDGLDLARGYKGIYLVTQPTSAPYHVKVSYSPGALSVYVDDVLVADRLAVDLAAVGAADENGRSFLGFSGKTRHIVAYHDIVNWKVTPGLPAGEATPLVLTHSAVTLGGTPQVSLTFTSTSGKKYRVTHSTDMVVWNPLGDPITATSASTPVTRSFPAGAKGFFRVEEVD